ncbi:sigma54 specific transcriptional regulator, Fis family [Carboxydocella sporoproducens DSM 16521]|uniref:Sigma54 specific transcriptional regulator, Fis family n=3 Tax=Carboxydocella TaxID=178898 RepID=A0A1T4RR75_9FIRM|nr:MULTISPECIES: sigma 54-interacting transcriptional regulator [Carboxydocella]AVX21885.1 4Fe-4S binding domain-containing protein [Carboxydocella thermautotrophica]AVX32288.1 4Fe-4S binding domain-containing protein [Carboxydocella thermautotrophica]GAW28072.1 sigma-54-dependent Fis family transcriptional regulator [Carboxydocella sp. ULO1]SKA18326.1 sigma54 specific transcriptional regulator, Fis family [Carboxydocella sporoproducens DSM 16521]
MAVVKTIQEKCKSCYACIRNCPVRAIKVTDKQAQILPERCISCGNCVRICAQKAKQIESDWQRISEMLEKKRRQPVIAILAPSFRVAFPEFSVGQVIMALKAIGFNEVEPVTKGIELTVPVYREYLARVEKTTVISSYCPAVVMLIQKHMPELIPNLAPIDSAVLALAKYLKLQNRENRVVFIGPCVAKKEEARDENLVGVLDGVLTFREIREIWQEKGIRPAIYKTPLSWEESLTELFPVSGGLLRNLGIKGRDYNLELAVVEGKDECLKVLQAVKRGEFNGKFLDILFCRGCIDGPEIASPLEFYGRKSLLFSQQRSSQPPVQGLKVAGLDLSRRYINKYQPLPEPSEHDIREILKFTQKINPEDELNCGACGYESCREKARAVYQGLAEIHMCLPYLLNLSQGEIEYYKDRLRNLDRAKPMLSLERILGDLPEVAHIKALSERAAQSDSTILITGESGVGKEVLAQAIHYLSPRANGPFIAINCAALPEMLLESELFGYEEGAFTGARKGGKPGKFELANGGTLLLDEIGDLPLTMQAKLLRVLQERVIERVGGTKSIKVDIRIIAATNQDLKKMVAEGRFRADLYYRLNVIGIHIPPLRDRIKDLPRLIDIIGEKLYREKGITPKVIAKETLDLLMTYHWPGNIRELENVLERSMYLAEGSVVRPEHLPSYLFEKDLPKRRVQIKPLKDAVRELEKELIEAALAEAGGNKVLASELLGIPRATLYLRLKEFGWLSEN